MRLCKRSTGISLCWQSPVYFFFVPFLSQIYICLFDWLDNATQQKRGKKYYKINKCVNGINWQFDWILFGEWKWKDIAKRKKNEWRFLWLQRINEKWIFWTQISVIKKTNCKVSIKKRKNQVISPFYFSINSFSREFELSLHQNTRWSDVD